MSDRIPVIVRTKNRPTELACCLNSLVWQEDKDFQVFIFDDNEAPVSASPIIRNAVDSITRFTGAPVMMVRVKPERDCWKLTVSILKMMLGFGMKRVLMLDDDEVAPPWFIKKLREAYDSEKGCGFVYCPIIEPNDALKRPVFVPAEKVFDEPPADASKTEARVSRYSEKAWAGKKPWVPTKFMAGGMTLFRLLPSIVSHMEKHWQDGSEDDFYGKALLKVGYKGFLRLDMFVIHNVYPNQWRTEGWLDYSPPEDSK